jgi:hypothetical protein
VTGPCDASGHFFVQAAISGNKSRFGTDKALEPLNRVHRAGTPSQRSCAWSASSEILSVFAVARRQRLRWTKKNDESFYGIKNHLGVDKAHKLIRKWDATHAAVHDSQKLEDLLDHGVWTDSA